MARPLVSLNYKQSTYGANSGILKQQMRCGLNPTAIKAASWPRAAITPGCSP